VSKRLINLTFHGIGTEERQLESGERAVWISCERFIAVLDAVADRDDIRITFDDGNRSDISYALPALRERGLSATFFVVAGRLGMPGFLTADDVRALTREGMAVGSHGMRHRPWRELDSAALREEVRDAKRVLEEVVEQPVTAAACPFGSYGRRSLAALRQAGYERVYTSDRGPAVQDAWLQARSTITERDPLEPILAGTSTFPLRAKKVLKRWR
jgi:peptidoglycan/xylan/chitin deacetylase (PgdA/CDA1 family)